MPPGGGDPFCYDELARQLGPDQPFYALRSVGLDGATAAHTEVSAMAAYYLDALRQMQPHGPYLLAGYSGGGLIAFEMAHQLRAADDDVALVAFIDTFCPTYLLKSQGDRVRWFVRGVREGGPRFLARWTWLKAGTTVSRLWTPPRPKGGDFWPRDEETQTVDTGPYFTAAQSTYRLRALDVHVAVFRASVRTEHGWLPPDLGWAPYVTGGISAYEIPGHHETMCLDPDVNVLAADMAAVIAAAHQRSTSVAAA